MIVPTGIGCEIGGHCGDGNAPARLLGACCDNLVLHPNVVNASDLNEMPPNALYVEGNHLDRFLQGKLFPRKVKSNKVLVVVNKADYQSMNAVSAARATIGLDAEILELRTSLQLLARIENGIAGGGDDHGDEGRGASCHGAKASGVYEGAQVPINMMSPFERT